MAGWQSLVLPALLGNLGNIVREMNVPNVGAAFPPGNDTPTFFQVAGPDGDGMNLPTGGGSRGTILGRLAAAALSVPDTTPPAPPSPGALLHPDAPLATPVPNTRQKAANNKIP